ncbi:hypothetical protein [Nocardia sp. NBC_01388]|uniref:hypothetical protein n=1 Tax=Nocardia sp. NBC_01388 TaxID=2903596 RepID=UPI0032515E8D
MTDQPCGPQIKPLDPSAWRIPHVEIDVDAITLTRHLRCGSGEIVMEIGVPRCLEDLLGTELTDCGYGNLPYACRFRIGGHRGEDSRHSGYKSGRDGFDSLAAAMSAGHSMALNQAPVEGDIRTASDSYLAILGYTIAPEHRGTR